MALIFLTYAFYTITTFDLIKIEIPIPASEPPDRPLSPKVSDRTSSTNTLDFLKRKQAELHRSRQETERSNIPFEKLKDPATEAASSSKDCNQWGHVHPQKVNNASSTFIFAQVPKTGTTTLSHMFRSLSDDLGWKWFTTPEYRHGMEDIRKQVL